MNMLTKATPFALAALLLAGCGTTGEVDEPAQPTPLEDRSQPAPEAAAPGAQAAGAEQGPEFALRALDDPASPLSRRIFYFEFDSSRLNDRERELIIAHGNFLAANPTLTVTLEGHADERGTREYNIGLGERRALSVRQLLLLTGAQAQQIATISYGEEKPAVLGNDEEAWSLNRRVEIIYAGR